MMLTPTLMVGSIVGWSEGLCEGNGVGFGVGAKVGLCHVGWTVGFVEKVGWSEGREVVGRIEGEDVGFRVGASVGRCVGSTVGFRVGGSVGRRVGPNVGSRDGAWGPHTEQSPSQRVAESNPSPQSLSSPTYSQSPLACECPGHMPTLQVD